MQTYETENGYIVTETMYGLDIYIGNKDIKGFRGELQGKCLADYAYENPDGDFVIDEDELEEDIELELDL